MASIDVGNIRFNWRGVFDSTQSYSERDVVRYASNVYVFKEALEANSGWSPDYVDLMVNGQTPIAFQGDLVYGDPDGDETRLAIGNPNDVLVVNALGNPQWSDVYPGKTKNYFAYTGASQSIGDGYTNITNLYVDITPMSANSLFVISSDVHMFGSPYGGATYHAIYEMDGQGNLTGTSLITPASDNPSTAQDYEVYSNSGALRARATKISTHAPGNLEQFRVQVQASGYQSSVIVNESSLYKSMLSVMEVVQ